MLPAALAGCANAHTTSHFAPRTPLLAQAFVVVPAVIPEGNPHLITES